MINSFTHKTLIQFAVTKHVPPHRRKIYKYQHNDYYYDTENITQEIRIILIVKIVETMFSTIINNNSNNT